MRWACKPAILGVAFAAFALMASSGQVAFGQSKPGTTTKPAGNPPGGSGTKIKPNPAATKYAQALATAVVKLKQAEMALAGADTGALNLAVVNPAVVQNLTGALQRVNQAYTAAQFCQQFAPPLGTPRPAGNPLGGAQAKDPVKRYNHALTVAIKCLKEAEQALMQANVKELNLPNTNPNILQNLIYGVSQTNQALILAQSCAQYTPKAPKK